MKTVIVLFILCLATHPGNCPTAGASNLVPNSSSPADSSAPHGKSAIVNRNKANANAKSADLSGTWYFSSTWRDWHSGRITLKQTDTKLTGMWHTETGKQEEDLPLFGEVVGNTVYLTKYNIWGKYENQNKFTLSLVRGGNQLFGYGEGFFLNHADLNMAREAGHSASGGRSTNQTASQPQGSKLDKPDVTGTWYFSSTWRDWHKGRITLKQAGTKLTGMWHTIEGKKEEDLPLFGEVVGNTVYLTRYNIWGKYENQNKFTLSLLNGGNQLFGYGEGFFLNHADLNMARADQTEKARSKISDGAKRGANAVSKADEHANDANEEEQDTENIVDIPSQTKAIDKPEGPSNSLATSDRESAAVTEKNTSNSEKTTLVADKNPPLTQPEEVQSPVAQWQNISKQLESLVKQFYPKAQFVVENDVIHFEFNIKHHVGDHGVFVLPQAGGIVGDIALKNGAPPDGARTIEEHRDNSTSTSTSTMTLATYSHKCQSHLATQLTYPIDSPPEFKQKFLSTINSF